MDNRRWEEQLLEQPEENESIFNMELPVIRERVAPGVQNAILMIKKKLLDVAISSFCGGTFRPLSTEFSERQIKILRQIEFLIKLRNRGEFLRPNWPELVEISLTREELLRRPSFYELYTSDNFLNQPNFIYQAKESRLREIFLKKIDEQFSILLQWPFLHRFLYKISIVDTDENVQNKDLELERISGFSRVHEEIFIPEVLEQIRQVLKSQFFCAACVQKFDKLDQILPHFEKYHKTYVSNETIEARKNSRDARRMQEHDDQMKSRHDTQHPNCDSCFLDRQ